MEVICLEEEAFYSLIDKVVEHIQEKEGRDDWQWIAEEEAMKLLNVTSKPTIQKLRDEGAIRFTQPRKKLILYDRDSIQGYLTKHAKDTF